MTKDFALPRSTPEAQGISSRAIMAFVEAAAAQQLELHSLMLVRHGQVVAEGWWSPYRADRIHQLYSLSKSFTSTAIGIAVDEGRLAVTDAVLSFFPDQHPEQVSDHLAAMQVHHLLSMATGHREDVLERVRQLSNDDWVKGFLAVSPDQAPGSIFTYNNGATFMLSAILQKLSGLTLVEYLTPRLFEPLGIIQTYWYQNPQGINQGFSGLHVTTETIAKLGQLYLQKGNWQGRQLISEAWVEKASAHQIANQASSNEETPDWAQGYGYQFWQCRHNLYRGDGAFGQFCLIMPQQDAVMAITSGVENMQAVLNLVWEYLLPAMADQPLPADQTVQHQLKDLLATRSIEPTQAETASPLAATISGSVYDFVVEEGSDNEERGTLSLDFQADGFTLVMVDSDGEATVRGGYNAWTAERTTFYDTEEVPIMSNGTWLTPDVFRVEIRYIQTPHCLTLDFYFDQDALRATQRWNVMFGSTEMAPIMGKLKL